MCCLVWILFIREFVDVLSGVDVVYTRIFRCAVVDVVYTRICICSVWF